MPPYSRCLVIRLIYWSRASTPVDLTVARTIAQQAERHNPPRGVTGLLACGTSHFLQVVEGASTEVNLLYRRLMHDGRHYDLHLVEVVPIQKRLFSEWAMELVYVGDHSGHRPIVQRYCGDGFDPADLDHDQALGLLMDLRSARLASGPEPMR